MSRNVLSFIGFGEAAFAFAESINREYIAVIKGFDIKLKSSDDKVRENKHQDFISANVEASLNTDEAAKEAGLMFSLVTADQAKNATESISETIEEKTFYFDGNSCSPTTKKANAELIEDRGAFYIDMAIMSPVNPLKNRAPLLISGKNAKLATEILNSLNLNPSYLGDEVGMASSVKMIRSIMVKGLEALMLECVLAGRKVGVDEKVIESLEKSFPDFDWKTKAAYMLERVSKHGLRRSAEMGEVDHFLQSLGFDKTMSSRTAELQKSIGLLNIETEQSDYQTIADVIIPKYLTH
jgi:3-hydroxyisobutyrate dehydrogenase-like beta-hydroxyacid dehydrogenase